MLEMALQILVAVLLVITIAYAVRLNRRLSDLRDGREEMRALTNELSAAMANAERGITSLRKTAFEDDQALGKTINAIRSARDEVSFLLDRAETLSARLEQQIDTGRPVERSATGEQRASPIAASADEDDMLFAAEPGNVDGPTNGIGDVDAAKAARATATAWLRNRRNATSESSEALAAPAQALR